MVMRIGVFVLFAVFGLVALRTADAVTIYRIGGEGLPEPEQDMPFDFVQLSWAEADPVRHGSAEALFSVKSASPAHKEAGRTTDARKGAGKEAHLAARGARELPVDGARGGAEVLTEDSGAAEAVAEVRGSVEEAQVTTVADSAS